MIIVERSYSNPIRRITTIHRSTRLKSESLMTIRKPLILLPPQSKSQELQLIQSNRSYVNNYTNLDNLNNLNKSLEFKQIELNNLKKKLITSLTIIEKQQEIITDLEQKQVEQEKEHNREIALLKSNLDNSIFDDNQSQNENNKIIQYDENLDNLQVIQEESEYQQNTKSLTSSAIQQFDHQTTKSQEILNALYKIQIEELNDNKIQDIINDHDLILKRIMIISDYIHKLEQDLEDWKCNYWNLERKMNSQLKDDKQQLTQEIEIEFDFDKNQLKNTNFTKKKIIKSNSLIEQNKTLLQENKKLKELNDQLVNQQKNSAKQVLEQLINKSKKIDRKKNLTHIPEPSTKQITNYNSQNNTQNKQLKNGSPFQQRQQQPLNSYFSHYFSTQRDLSHQNSPNVIQKSCQSPSYGIKVIKDTSMDHYYNLVIQTPIIIKKQSLSPYQRSGHKFLQF